MFYEYWYNWYVKNYFSHCFYHLPLPFWWETRGGFTIEFSEMRGPNKIFGSFCKINEPNILFGPLISENSIVTPPLAWENIALISLFLYNLMTGQDQMSLPLVILFLFETLINNFSQNLKNQNNDLKITPLFCYLIIPGSSLINFPDFVKKK